MRPGLSNSSLLASAALLLAAAAVAAVGADPFVGGWNDAGRLATVESLVDRQTWQIDGSIFLDHTLDRAFIDGHFYSHRSPVPALGLAALYQIAQWTTGLEAASNPTAFCYTMVLFSAGLAFVVAVLSMDRLGTVIGLNDSMRWPLTWSFAFGTLAVTYSRAVNDHILLLAALGVLFVVLATCAARRWIGVSASTLVLIGTLIGIGYVIDLGVGPMVVACLLGYVAWCIGPTPRLALVVVAALPWIALHHGLTHWIGGTWKPLGAVAEYMVAWPGSPFTVDNLTGLGWAHESATGFASYAVGLLVGPRGFLVHNPVLVFVAPALVMIGRFGHDRALAVSAAGLIASTYLVYAITSNNYAGETASIRWFVPLLVPCFYLLMRAVQHDPRLRSDILVVGLWSIVLGALIWRRGPWVSSIGPRLWVVNAAIVATWVGYRLLRRSNGGLPPPGHARE